MGFELILFLALGSVAIISAALMVLVRNAVHSALFLIVNFACVALLFLMLDAPFISMVQIAVYAGAIMVLFLLVIMLLGGEMTSDTAGSGGFKWMTGAATILAVLFVVALGGMVVISGGLELPEAPGSDPMLRVVHSAKVTDSVTVSIAGGALAEPIVLSDVVFSDVSDFVTVAVGEYTVTLTDTAGNTLSQTVALENNGAMTVVAYGAADAGTLAMLPVPASFATTLPDRARMRVVNVLSAEPVTLANLGADLQIDETNGVISDHTLVRDVAYGTVTEAFDVRDGEYPLAFYALRNGVNEELVRMLDWRVAEGSEQLVILTPDYAATTDLEGNYRPRVLDRAQEILVIRTLEQFGSPRDVGSLLFTAYLLPVNLVGFLLLVALIGVIVLTRPAGLTTERRSTINRRRKVSRPLVSVISQQTGRDVIVDTPRLEEPDTEN